MNIDYDEILEVYAVSSLIYNEIGNGTLKALPQAVFMKIDHAVSRALIVGILAAKYDLTTLNETELDDVVNELFDRLLYNNSHE